MVDSQPTHSGDPVALASERSRGRRATASCARSGPVSALDSLLGRVLWIGLALWIAGCGAAPRPPSVLLLTIDTLRPDYLSSAGYDRPTSPTLDALFDRGYRFERAITPIARTTPALASLLAGAYPHTTGVRTLTDGLARDVESLAERMQREGYATFAVVANDLLEPTRGLARGFDVYHRVRNHERAAGTTELALSLFDDLPAERRFFAWVHYFDPHVPYDPPDGLAEAFDPGYVGRYARSFGNVPDAENRRFHPFPMDLPKASATHTNTMSAEVNAHLRRLYAADVRSTDDALGPLLEAARERAGGELLIVVTADHGESLGEHDFYFDHGDYVYEASLRIPFAFVLPDSHPLRGSGRCDAWVSLIDVVPSVLELLGHAPGESLAAQVEGRSVVPCLRGETLAPRAVFAESGRSFYPDHVRGRRRFDVSGRFRSVTLDSWKLIWTPFAPDSLAWQLYDLDTDPAEQADLYRPDHPRVGPLRAELEAWLSRAGQPDRRAPIGARDAEALRALGYAE